MAKIPSEQALLAEYQVCQDARNEQSSSFWTFAGIFLGLSGAALGFIVPYIFKIHDNRFRILVIIIGFLMILIYVLIMGYLKHINGINRSFTDRMKQIEVHLGMGAIRNRDMRRGIRGACALCGIVAILSLIWIAVIVLSLII